MAFLRWLSRQEDLVTAGVITKDDDAVMLVAPLIPDGFAHGGRMQGIRSRGRINSMLGKPSLRLRPERVS